MLDGARNIGWPIVFPTGARISVTVSSCVEQGLAK